MLSWLFPYRCILCLAPGDERDLCRDCAADLPWAGSGCPRCARPLPADMAGLPCGRCLRRPPPQASTLAAFRYAFPVDQMVLKLKFSDDLVAGRVLGELLADRLSAAAPMADMIVPGRTGWRWISPRS
jgi:predicted amidophosphoribosyltransferase